MDPENFAGALDADPAARAAYDRMSPSRGRAHLLADPDARVSGEPSIRRVRDGG